MVRLVFEPEDEGGTRHAHFATDLPQENSGGGTIIEEDTGGTLGAVVVSAAEQYSHIQILQGYQTLPLRTIRIGLGGRAEGWVGMAG